MPIFLLIICHYIDGTSVTITGAIETVFSQMFNLEYVKYNNIPGPLLIVQLGKYLMITSSCPTVYQQYLWYKHV